MAGNNWTRLRRFALICGTIFCILFVGQCTLVAVNDGQIEWWPTKHLELGFSGISVIALWSHEGRTEIAWDDLPGWFRFSWHDTVRLIEIPFWIFFPPVAIGTFILWHFGKRPH